MVPWVQCVPGVPEMVVYMGTIGTTRTRGAGEGGLYGCNRYYDYHGYSKFPEVVNYTGARDTISTTGTMGNEGGCL